MVLIFHITIALASLAYTAYLFFRPAKSKLRISYGLAALTIISGTYLIASQPAHMVQACVSGIIYLGVMFAGIAAVRLKLASETINRN